MMTHVVASPYLSSQLAICSSVPVFLLLLLLHPSYFAAPVSLCRPVSAASSSLFFCFRLSVASGLKQVFFKWVIMQKKKRDLRCRFSKFPPPFSWGFAKKKGFGEDYSTRTKEIPVSNSCCCYLEFPSNNKLGEVGYGPVSNQTILHDGPLDSWLRWWCRLKVNNQYHE